MAELSDLRTRGEALFTRLLHEEAAGPAELGLTAVESRQFNWFDPGDAMTAATLAFRLAAQAASRDPLEDGLEAALDDAEARIATDGPAAVRQALALFTTHNRRGRNLVKPRSVVAGPELFLPSNGSGPAGRLEISEGGPSPELDYWREDALANEHHEHWHQVYPFTGIPPADVTEWVENTPVPDLAAILNTLEPRDDWQQQIEAAPTSAVASLFATLIDQRRLRTLPPDLFQQVFRLNDRHGELFLYMHQQMLARYDAELISHGLERVEPFGPDDWRSVIPVGHDPEELPFGRRPPGRQLDDEAVDRLEQLEDPIDVAVSEGSVVDRGGQPIPLDPVRLGEAVEAAINQLTSLDPDRYGGLHNAGHVALASLASEQLGVMASTVTAIRDPIFWRWHKHIDDVNARWQDTRSPWTFEDAPPVTIGVSLVRAAAEGADPAALPTVDELHTRTDERLVAGRPVRFLTHEPFGYVFRVANAAPADAEVTIRVHLAPAITEDDRRSWIEMDKFILTVPGASETIHYRPDTSASVVKRPAEVDPGRVVAGGGDADERSYCDCGWPWTLLLPRGSPDGTPFRLAVLATDAAIDQVAEPEHCGSMSFCGAVDRYPDSRPMGYPFDRPFRDTIASTFTQLANAATLDLTIVHDPSD